MAGVGARERILAETTLICLLQAAHGHVTTVELRNEASAKGRVDNVDGFMNIVMSNVEFTKRTGEVLKFPTMFIHGRQIRYVQIPDEIDMRAALREQANKFRNYDKVTAGKKGAKKMPRR